jgi:surface polysaccharide O-acyltransferase-like enzyme
MKREDWADALRCVAAFWVVMIHVAAVPATHMADIPLSWWRWADAYDAACRAAMPAFIMVSGALLLTRTDWDTATFLRRRALKLAPAMLFWSLAYDAWKALTQDVAFTVAGSLRHVVNGLNAPAYPHLWFLWLIAGLYLLTPLLQPFAAHASRATHVFVAALWFASTAIVPALTRCADVTVGIYTQPIVGYVGYFVVGASLHRFAPARLGHRLVALLAVTFVAAAAWTAIATDRLSVPTRRLDELYMDSLSPSVIAMAVSAFLLARHWVANAPANGRGRAALLAVSSSSFGIYLLHPLFIDLADAAGLSLDPLLAHPAGYLPALAAAVFAASLLATMALRRSRAGRWILP